MDEYINKQAFLDHMKRTDRYFNVKFDIENFPNADVAPVRHGRWEPTEAPFMNECEDCSVCGYRTVWGHRYNYCPNCGAKMDEEGNDNEP